MRESKMTIKQHKGIERLQVLVLAGAFWGLLEATLGYVLHLVPTLVSGMIMFPIATLILSHVYTKTGKKVDLMGVAIIASLIKSVDLLLPALPPIKTINPMMAILFEGLLVMGLVVLFEKGLGSRIMGALTASIGWRLLFLVYMAILPIIGGPSSKLLSSPASIIEFALIHGIAGSLPVVIFTYVPKLKVELRPVVRYGLTFSVLVLASVTTYLL